VRITSLKRWVLSAVAGVGLGAGSADAQTPPPIFTRNPALRLPVQLDERSRAEVAGVKLYVRGPDGKWECVQTAVPTQTAFDFRAPADGEYAFTFVTVDRRGTANPANVEAGPPHRTVVVDATPPDVTAQPLAHKGEKFLQCHVRDANADWSSVRVVYLAADNTWQPLAPVSADAPNLFRVPNSSVLESKLRVTAADRAGNRTTREIDLGDPTVAAALPPKPAVDRGKPDPVMLPKDADPERIVPPAGPDRDVRGAGFTDLPKTPKADIPPLPDLPPVGPAAKAPDAAMDIKLPDPPGSRIVDTPPGAVPTELPVPKVPDARPDPYKADVPPVVTPDGPGAKPPVPGTTAALKPADPEMPAVPPVPPAKADPKPAESPKGSHPILNTRTCTINYQLDAPGRWSNRIDFWATPDGGRTWVAVKDAAGGIPPAKLTMPADGVFGIRIRPGGGSKPPEPGEDPDCVIEVDTTRPLVNLLPPTVAAEDGTMVLSWTAADSNLLRNAISLYYATRPEGPWEVIVSGYKNEGLYRWALPTGLSGAVYLRLEAADRAGNVGRMDLPTPVTLDAGKQRVRVLEVGPGR
jgi:hypothetical protein